MEPSDWILLVSIVLTFLVSVAGLTISVKNSRNTEALQRETNRQNQSLTLLEQRQAETLERERLRQTETLEIAKLASSLWEKQARFAETFFPAVTALRNAILRSGYMPTEETAKALHGCRSVLLEFTPTLPKDVASGLHGFLDNIDTMFLQAATGFQLPPGTGKKEILEEAGKRAQSLFKQAGFPDQEERLRDLLATDELSAARKRALGLLDG